MSKVYDWFEERLEIQSIADDISSKYVPPHVNIFYCLGGITLVCFLVQVATGFAMTFYPQSLNRKFRPHHVSLPSAIPADTAK